MGDNHTERLTGLSNFTAWQEKKKENDQTFENRANTGIHGHQNRII